MSMPSGLSSWMFPGNQDVKRRDDEEREDSADGHATDEDETD